MKTAITFPVIPAAQGSDLAGCTLFVVTGRTEGKDDETTFQYWVSSEAEARKRFIREFLELSEYPESDIAKAVDGEDLERNWGYIVAVTAVATVSEDGTSVTFLN